MMKTTVGCILIFLLSVLVAWGACTGSSPNWTTTPDKASVFSCVSGASDGDTITVSAGAETWDARLIISRGIKLIGPGSANLTITNSYVCDSQHTTMITYTPTDFEYDALATDYSFRISGFTFDGGGVCSILAIRVNTSNIPQRKVRIDHTVFQSTMPANTAYGVSIFNEGAWGVVDNNILSGYIPVRSGNGGNKAWWDNWNGINYGSNENMYFEDNVINSTGILGDCQYGDRYAFRYNTINMADQAFPMFDLHGNGTNYYACFGGEIYGNHVVSTVYEKLNQQRGGKMVVAMNNCTNCNGVFFAQVREEAYGQLVTDNPCQDQNGVTTYCSKDGQQQYIHDSYYWANRINFTTDDDGGAVNVSAICSDHTEGTSCEPPALDTPKGGRDYFSPTTTPAIVCGTNKGVTCSTGALYFETSQSCSSLSGMVGANPSAPISGALYSCTAPNVWSIKWAPYTYPHPLRGIMAGHLSGGFASGGLVSQ